MRVPRTISDSMLTDVGNGEFTVTIANPLEFDFSFVGKRGDELFNQGQPLTGPACVLSIDPFGEPQVRPNGAQGSQEKFKKDGAWIVVEPVGGRKFRLPYKS